MEDLVNKLTSDKDNLWLGFNKTNHWVILDRELSSNKNGLASIFLQNVLIGQVMRNSVLNGRNLIIFIF